MAIAAVDATACDLALSIEAIEGQVMMNLCERSQIFKVLAKIGDCVIDACEVTFTWKEDTMAPAFMPPAADITIAADNDQWTEGNPGLTKARQAAAMTRAKVIYPDFTGMDTSSHPTDFNDYVRLGGVI